MNEDFSDVIRECGIWISVLRAQAPDMVNGRVQAAPKEKTIRRKASVQPMPTRELQQLPEGARNKGAVVMFIDVPLLTVETSTCRVPDRFEYRGATYQVYSVDEWEDLAGYYRASCVRVTT